MTTNAQRIQFLVAQETGFNRWALPALYDVYLLCLPADSPRSRLPALYSDFRGLRTTNPEGFAANVAAWRRGLASLVRGGLLPAAAAPSASSLSPSSKQAATSNTTARSFLILIAGRSLLDALQSDRYGRPLALDAVIQEAVQDRDLIPLEAFLRAKESVYSGRRSWAAWAVGLPWRTMSWGLHQLGVLGEGQATSSTSATPSALASSNRSAISPDHLVVLSNVEAAAAAFADKTAGAWASSSPFERVWSVAHFKRVFSAPGAILDSSLVDSYAPPRLSDMDLDVLLTFLARDQQLVVCDGRVVKLHGAGEPATLSDEDLAVAQLRELVESLSHQTTVLSHRVDDLAAAAKAALASGNRVAALAALRQKKQAEAVLATRFGTLAQLEATAAQLQQASDSVQVTRAMTASADALAALNAQVGGAAGVQAVVDRLRAQIDAGDEIAQIMVEAGPASTSATGNGLVIDEGEIDDELAALEREEDMKKRSVADEAAARAKAQTEADELKQAEETRQRLASAGAAPDKVSPAAIDALEAEATESLGRLSLKSDEPQADLGS